MTLFYKQEIANLITKTFTNINNNEIINLIDKPPKKEMGDYTIPCFKLAEKLKINPINIARNFTQIYPKTTLFSKISHQGPYINFSIEKYKFIQSTLKWTLSLNKNSFLNIGKNKNIIIDFSSPNIAKPFSIAHLRSTSIGNSLYNIFSFIGYKVTSINHIGDWGTSFGKLISAYIRWGKNLNLNQKPIQKLLELYIKFHKEAKINENLNQEAKEYFKKLENNNTQYINIWNKFKELSLKEFKRIYKLLNVSFDHYTGESFYRQFIPHVLEEIKNKKLAVKSEGALIIPLEKYNMPPFLLEKEDGTSLYGTRDIASAIYRKNTFKPHNILYVVGNEQTLYFKQLFKVLELMNYKLNCEHIKFGLMHFKEGKMSTREGKIIFLEDVIEKAKLNAINKIKQTENTKNKTITNTEIEKLALKIGLSSVIFFDLKNTREKDCSFDWDEVLNPKGETGIYLQYAHARLSGIIRNFQKHIGTLPQKCPTITEYHSFEITQELAAFKEKIIYAANQREPSTIARFALDLAQKFSSYYKLYQVVNPKNKELSYQRIITAIACKKILAFSLNLLGIKPLDKI